MYASDMTEAQGDVRCTGGKRNVKEPQATEHEAWTCGGRAVTL